MSITVAIMDLLTCHDKVWRAALANGGRVDFRGWATSADAGFIFLALATAGAAAAFREYAVGRSKTGAISLAAQHILIHNQ
ncbi:MAG: hypothetical protein ACLPID_09060 [Beijerinckiaceae bacterium]